ncbi:hypothetical protein HU200_062945 [Digitaria exilis]|uniref:Uncharacterized protein n=1 Tax=Digitaria exilis TaxID=1010633 RepID=A0A835DZZ0_9POAL|nr:hypothetical protein HU200_062945 [Digitaria exilis]
MPGVLGKYASLYLEICLVPYLSRKERGEDQADMLMPASLRRAQMQQQHCNAYKYWVGRT